MLQQSDSFRSRSDGQTRRIWSWLAAEQRASGPFCPYALAAAVTTPTVFQSLSASKSFKRGCRCLLYTFWTREPQGGPNKDERTHVEPIKSSIKELMLDYLMNIYNETPVFDGLCQ